MSLIDIQPLVVLPLEIFNHSGFDVGFFFFWGSVAFQLDGYGDTCFIHI